MGIAIDLFNVLESVDAPPNTIRLDPADALECASLALKGEYELAAALDKLNEQIRKFRQILRGVHFNQATATEGAGEDFPASLYWKGSELHKRAALICMRQNAMHDAGYHLLRALSCDPQDQDTRFHFVKLYKETSAYMDAFDQLQETFGETDDIGKFCRLFQLTWDIHRTDPEGAFRLYEKLSKMDDAGVLGELARLQSEIIKRKLERPTGEQVQMIREEGAKLEMAGNLIEALNLYLEVLCWYPFDPLTWSRVGGIYFTSVVPAESDRETALVTSYRDFEFNKDEQLRLKDAIRACEMALLGDPQMGPAYGLLINCYLLMTDIETALRLAETACRELPEYPYLAGLYALALSWSGNFNEARAVAADVLIRDPNQLYALKTLERLKILGQ